MTSILTYNLSSKVLLCHLEWRGYIGTVYPLVVESKA